MNSAASQPPKSLVELITRKPFRRTAVDADTLEDIKRKASMAQSTASPLEFSLPFGGYKARDLPGGPHLNWAEVFWLEYLRRYATPLAEQHAPGVVISFSYVSGVLEFINGIPAAEQQSYLHELSQLLHILSCERIRFRLVDIADAYGGPQAALQATQALYQTLRDTWAPSEGELQARLSSARRNLLHNDEQTADAAAVRDAALKCAAMESLEQRRAFNKFGPRIQLSHMRGASLSLHLGSCRSSVVQPWVGYGLLDNGIPRIVSSRAALAVTAQPAEHVMASLTLAPGQLDRLRAINPAFNRIPVTAETPR